MAIKSYTATKIRRMKNAELAEAMVEASNPIARAMLVDEAVRRLRSLPEASTDES